VDIHHLFKCYLLTDVKSPGDVCGQGLTNEIADQLELLPNTPVGISIIDAHAGVLG
jgi:ribulose kinase